ncbi:MAG TPA: hypothetical protein VEI83_01735 [Acidimicrobiales bacterium]|nr:hypothetical protein [Acidimicrobiales bacterium]
MLDPEVIIVLRLVPEFAERYLTLVEEVDGDPGAVLAFTDLADFTAALARELDRRLPLLERCLGAIEEVAATSPDADELVGWAFLDTLSPEETRALGPWLGPATRALLERLELQPGEGRPTG